MDRENQELSAPRLTPEERSERVKKLKRKRRFRLALVITAFVLVLCLILSPVLLFAVFKIDNFAIEGETLYKEEEIIAASGISYGKSIFFADLDEAKVKIESTLPYTNNVQLARRLPDTIVITLESTDKAYAVEKSEGIYAITNRDFKVLEVSGIIPDGVIPVIGALPEKAEPGSVMSFIKEGEQTDATLNLIRSISAAIADSEIQDINLVSVRSRSNIYMVYQERIVLRLGDSSEIDKKVALGKKVIEQENAIDETQTGIINLTVSKKAYFNPADEKDIPELAEYKTYAIGNEKDSQEQAFAIETDNGSYAITNPTFKVLEFSKTAPEGIIPLEGYIPEEAKTGEILSYGSDDETKTAHSTIRELYEAADESGIKDIDLIGFDGENDIYIIYQERMVLRIGSMKNLENKLSKGKEIIDEENENDDSAVGIVYLSDPDDAYFEEEKYQDIDELMDYKPVYDESEEETTEDSEE